MTTSKALNTCTAIELLVLALSANLSVLLNILQVLKGQRKCDWKLKMRNLIKKKFKNLKKLSKLKKNQLHFKTS